MSRYIWQKLEDCYTAQISLESLKVNFLYRQENNMSQQKKPCIITPGGFDLEYTSEDVIIVGDTHTSEYVLAGATTAFRAMTHFSYLRRGAVADRIIAKQYDIKSDETPEGVVVLKGTDWREMLKTYAELVADAMSVKKIEADRNLTGYCTWYYYYADVTEKDSLENLDAMKAHIGSGYSPEIFQIDDGYQTFQGDWLDQHETWPTPLPVVAKRITGTGLRAGIWLMPFQASTASRVYREHPDWFVKAADGSAKTAHGWSPAPDDAWACLDMTIPEVREHITHVFKEFRKMGITYFKMDGLGFGLMAGRRRDPDATAVSAFRLGLQAIRDAVPDAFLLGCCPPFMPCLGLVDACRISQDTAANWPAIRNAMYEVLGRWWMFDKFFRCDPDALMARQDRAQHTAGEARVSVMMGILTGVSITSDNLNTIAADRMELLERSAQLRLRDAVPMSWTPNDHAEAFSGTINGKKAVALINHHDEDRIYSFADLGFSGGAEEMLHPLGRLSGSIRLTAHDAALLVEA